MPKDATLHIRIEPELLQQVADAAKRDSRTLSGFVVWCLRRGLGDTTARAPGPTQPVRELQVEPVDDGWR